MKLKDISPRCVLFIIRWHHFLSKYAKVVLRRLLHSSTKKPEPKSAMHNRLILAAARKLSLKVDELPYQFLRISDGAMVIYSRGFDFSLESGTAYEMCGDKHLTSLLLRQAGVPVPDYTVFDTNELGSAFAAFSTLKPPLVVKPCFGTAGGEGITVAVNTLRQFRWACYRAAISSNRVLVEQFVTGRHWRVTLLDGELIFACERLPAFVVGDGKSSISTLVRQHNESIGSRDGFPNAYPIHLDRDAYALLKEQDLVPCSVPPPGSRIVLKRICNAAVGGLTVDITPRLHDDYLTLARKAASTMGAKLAGVDIIAPDLTAPLDVKAVVNEVNTTPDLMLSHFDVSRSGDAIETVGRLLSRVLARKLGVEREFC